MIFNRHSGLEKLHAFLSPSKYHWVNYDDAKLETSFNTYLSAQMGTRLHAFASECISLGIKLAKTKQTLNMFVNDAIGFKMDTEVTLFFSHNCFGTSDAISFYKDILRIHDLKTGVTKASFCQLEVYAAIFCLEYSINPKDICTKLRIYQNDDVVSVDPNPDTIQHVMNKIVYFDKYLNKLKK